MKNKTNKAITLTVIGLILLITFLIFILNYSKDDSSFSILEKKWIKDNTNNIIDVSIYNDIPIYGKNGQGISFDYLDKFSEMYNIEFNKVSYLSDSNETYKNVSFRIKDNVEKEDILLYEDSYAVVSNKLNNIDRNSDLTGKKVGILKNDTNVIPSYLVDVNDISYTNYDDINALISALDNDIDYMIIPKNIYFDKIIENDLLILYHINDLSKKYVLTVSQNETLLEIMRKYTNQFNDSEYKDIYKNNYTKTIFSSTKLSEVELANYNSNSYIFGYVVNMPFENIDKNNFVGTLSNYLNEFEDLFGIDFKLIKYNNVTSLKKALSNGEVDMAFANFNADGTNIDKIYTISPFKEEYVVISKEYNAINSLKGLKDKQVLCVANTYINDYLTSNDVNVKIYDNTDELLRNTTNNAIVVIDKATYQYYQSRKFVNYKILYEDVLANDYSFVIRDVDKNKTFASLFSNYMMERDYNQIKYKFNTNYDLTKGDILNTIIKYGVVVLLVIIGILFCIKGNKNKKKNKAIAKDDKLKFIDVMTSLKNRNYLNYNMPKWEENVIYPQSIVVIDLNNIKYINDNFGHEIGDEEIKKAASILINNQLEKTDIMRTDGNEFLIYMVGYDEKYVNAYVKKLYKELKGLPHGFGAAIGYSMIVDDIKTVDDAINEATLEMRTLKEKL